ncbi:MAG: hypothetical protein LWW86_00815 [Micrococcales bacterium]|nr:hypothetical protein [Micrococcales bacterium]
MHRAGAVEIHEINEDGTTGAPVGAGWIVSRGAVLMRDPGASARMPMRAVVPVTAGGGRDGRRANQAKEIECVRLHYSEGLEGYVALELAQEWDGELNTEVLADAAGKAPAGGARQMVAAKGICDWFPRLPGCR